jgi:tetratricopeptide (TPR) repeat protein
VDLTTLLTVAGLFLSVVVGNAALFGDSLFVSLTVPKSVETRGFDRASAESLFAAEVSWYTRLPSILSTPSVSTSSTPSVAMAMAAPLKLQDLVHAVQTQVRSDVVNVSGAIVEPPEAKGLTMLLVINNPPDPPIRLRLARPDGDFVGLVKDAARETMIWIAPYRVVVSDLKQAVSGDTGGLQRAVETALRGVSAPWDPSTPGATETVLLHNILAVLRILADDLPEAQRHFKLALETPGAQPAAYGLVQTNQAFVALMARDPGAAQAFYQQARPRFTGTALAPVLGRFEVIEGMIAWQQGDAARAEALFRQAVAVRPTQVEQWYYLANLLEERGDKAGAEQAREAMATAMRFDQQFSSMAHTVFGLNLHTGKLDPYAFYPPEIAARLRANPQPIPAETRPAATAAPAR